MRRTLEWAEVEATGGPPSACHCRCGTIFASRTRTVFGQRFYIESREPCPGCSRSNDLVRVGTVVLQ